MIDILSLFRKLREPSAAERLQAMVDARANSLEVRNYRINRAAAKRGWATRRGVA
jgi:hypothetical protein